MPVLKLSPITCAHCPAACMAYIDVATDANPKYTCDDCKAKKKKKDEEKKKKHDQCLCYPCWKARYCRDHSCDGCTSCVNYICEGGQVHHSRLRHSHPECVILDEDEEVITDVEYIVTSSSSSRPKKKGFCSFTVPFPESYIKYAKPKAFDSRFHIYKNESNGVYTEFEEYAKGKMRPVRELDPGSGRWFEI